MRVNRHTYSPSLKHAAEEFLIDQFSAPTQYTEASHLPDLIDAAMHIVTDAAWIQPSGSRSSQLELSVGEYDADDDEADEDEDEE
jgi:hypothetical protein